MYNESVAECSKCGSRLDDKNSMWCEDCYGELREEIDMQNEVIESLRLELKVGIQREADSNGKRR